MEPAPSSKSLWLMAPGQVSWLAARTMWFRSLPEFPLSGRRVSSDETHLAAHSGGTAPVSHRIPFATAPCVCPGKTTTSRHRFRKRRDTKPGWRVCGNSPIHEVGKYDSRSESEATRLPNHGSQATPRTRQRRDPRPDPVRIPPCFDENSVRRNDPPPPSGEREARRIGENSFS
jgi:hypothetical protein